MRDILPSERLAMVGWMFARGERFTVNQLAERTGLTNSGAYKLLERVSCALPITVIGSTDEGGHIWAAMDAQDGD